MKGLPVDVSPMAKFTFLEVHLDGADISGSLATGGEGTETEVVASEEGEEGEGGSAGTVVAALVGLVFLVTVAYVARKYLGGEGAEDLDDLE